MGSDSPISFSACLAVGAKVRIHGVTSKPELNGKCGHIFKLSEKSGRWGVTVDDERCLLLPSKLTIVPPDAVAGLFAGAVVRITGLVSKPELNGRVACLVKVLGNGRWAVHLGGPTPASGGGAESDQLSVRPESLEVLPPEAAPPLVHSAWEVKMHRVDVLASYLVHYFVEGPGCYPVLRRLGRVACSERSEELFPLNAAPCEPQSAATWSDLPKAEAERLFYKASLTIRCSEMVLLFEEMANRVLRHKTCMCVGYVTHNYRHLGLGGDFGQNMWQHSHLVHNRSRNHMWIEAVLDDEPERRVILDLASAQFDARTPGKSFLVTSCGDSRYRKCYEIPQRAVALKFVEWMCSQNIVPYDGLHFASNVRRLVQEHKLNDSTAPSCLGAHEQLKSMQGALERRLGRSVHPGELKWAVMENKKMRELEEGCGITMAELDRRDEEAVVAFSREFGSEALSRIHVA